jgi:phosphoribosylformimino-5-aminoimidazole carboxamide ribotide isomerase
MFRPCIDLHEGKVKQIVGGSLSGEPGALRTNYVSDRPAAWYAELYRRDEMTGGHVIMLGPGNEAAASSALEAYPGGLQIGGGINATNARHWLDAGASQVIVTSWVFRDGKLDSERLALLENAVGRQKLVLDLSCRRIGSAYVVMTDRWQNRTELEVRHETLRELSSWCSEFLVHAVDVEGLCRGVEMDLVRLLAEASPIPVTYAGGARTIGDLEEVTRVGQGKVHLTIGSALDIFGGTGVKYEEVVEFNRRMGGKHD